MSSTAAYRYKSVAIILALSVVITSTATSSPSADQYEQFRRPADIPFPADNGYTVEKATLGKMLFFDPRLSRDRNISCASCHNPSFGWEVPFDRAVGAGGRPLSRHAPTTINTAWGESFFSDGRATTLEEQARGPIESDVEMDLKLSNALKRIASLKGYQQAFGLAFPNQGLSESTVLMALATFQRTLVSVQTPFDTWIDGDDSALSDKAAKGFELFVGKAKCVRCHSGWNMSDNRFHDTGLPSSDTGRFEQTGAQSDRFAFKTPNLREIASRAPYMHNGSLPNLDVVIAHYVSGGVKRDSRSPLITPLVLSTEERTELKAFLESLSSEDQEFPMPLLPAE